MREAPGGPGPGPAWGPGAKQGFGTSPDPRARVWFTLARGNLSEVFYPRLDSPCLHDLRFIASGRGTPPVDDALEAEHEVRWLDPGVPVFRATSTHEEYRLVKEFCCDPELDAILVSGEFTPELPDVALYLQASAHLVPGGAGNDAFVLDRDPPVVALRRGDAWMVVVAPFDRALAGFLNSSDVLVDLHDNDGEMRGDWSAAVAGNVAAGGRLGIRHGPFQLAVGFGRTREIAEDVARRALRRGAKRAQADVTQAWRHLREVPSHLVRVAGDGGALARASMAVLRSLEDTDHPGAFIAAPAAPWGEQVHDGDQVYHLVWPRDLFHVATGLLDAGDPAPAQRALAYLSAVQQEDGGWAQNFDLDGRPHWRGEELDEVALPVLLAWRLGVADALLTDPWPHLVRTACACLARRGPATELDRWEDAGGLSPSTLAAAIAALSAGAEMAASAGEPAAAEHLLAVADYWNDRLATWCYLQPFRHYVRLNPDGSAPPPRDSAVGVEFVELVRRGLRQPADPTIEHSLTTADALLRVDFPAGPSWRRYVGDRYGETASGGPWDLAEGIGRPWPVLTGERGHQAHAQGEPVAAYIAALEAFAGPELLLPEQVWDADGVSGRDLRYGGPTGSVRPLGWAHAEYLRLLAAVARGAHPDVVDPARRRYAEGRAPERPAFVWHAGHAFGSFPAGRRVRVQLEAPGIVRWSPDGWATFKDVELADTGLGLWVGELPTDLMRPGAVIEWTSRHPDGWEGTNHALRCIEPA